MDALHLFFVVLLTSSVSTFSWANDDSAPVWTKSVSNSLVGRKLKAVCVGQGPAVDLARKEALNSCLATAHDQIQNEIRIKTLTIETEKDLGFHQEVSSDQLYKNLNCDQLKQEIQENSASFRVWLLCEFDLSKVEQISFPDKTDNQQEHQNTILNKSELETNSDLEIKSNSHLQKSKDKVTISIASVPNCTDMLIRGTHPRVIKCSENPLSVIVMGGDESILVRAKGYQPKTIKLSPNNLNEETVKIILEPN